MDWPTFDKYQSHLLQQVVVMKDTKGKEYAHGEDRFGNFNRLAKELGLTNLQVAWVYLKKHLDSIVSFVKDQKVYSVEPIEGRFIDAITYLTLMAGMAKEIQNGPREAVKKVVPQETGEEPVPPVGTQTSFSF